MTKKIYDFMEKYNMLSDCGTVVVGLSGGADSVCLLLTLKEIVQDTDISLAAVHVNHGIRGSEAERDEEFSRQLCKKLDVEFICRHTDVPALAKREHLTEEEAGRKVRYGIFEEIAKERENFTGKGVRIATAHHKNDRAETVLMNMFRGSSLQGLRGIMPVRGKIIRPLLCVTRSEIEDYLLHNGQTFMVDSTNMDSSYSRNFIRNEVLPQAEKYSNGAVEHIVDCAQMIAEAHDYICMQADRLYTVCAAQDYENKKAVLNLSCFADQPTVLQRQVIYRLLGELTGSLKDIYRVHVETVLALCFMQSGKSVDIAYNVRATREYDRILFDMAGKSGLAYSQQDFSITIDENMLDKVWSGEKVTIPVNAPIYFNDKILSENAVIELEQAEISENFAINDYTKFFDYDKIENGLLFRYRQSGDRIVVNSSGQSKSLKKELTDRKVPQALRSYILLLADGSRILWAAGIRRSESCLVGENAKKVLKISITDTSVHG